MGAVVSIVPALDLREHPNDPNAPDTTPASIEAEQALIGAILFDNEAFDYIGVDLAPEHFYEPFHQRLWASIQVAHRTGLRIEPIALKEEFRRDPAFKELGGLGYLVDLVDQAPPPVNAGDYARQVYDLAGRRELIRVGERIAAMARGKLVEQETGARFNTSAIIEHAERELLKIQLVSSGPGKELVDIGDAAQAVVAYVDDRTQAAGIKSGIQPIDLQLGPLLPGDLVLLAGRPSMGKSAVALCWALNTAAPHLADRLNGRDQDGRPARGVLEIHAEMSVNAKEGGQVARRHISDIGYGLYGKDFPTYRQIRDKHISVHQREILATAASQLAGVPIRGLKRTGLTLSALRSLARRQIATWAREGIEPGIIVVDHVGLLRPDGFVKSRYEAQTEIAIGMKELADELGVPVVALVQLSRDIERRDDKRPQLSDLRDSGAWEENADAVGFVYRDAYYATREKAPAETNIIEWGEWDGRRKSKTIEVIMGKVREGDAGQSAMIWGDLAWNAIRGCEPDYKGGML